MLEEFVIAIKKKYHFEEMETEDYDLKEYALKDYRIKDGFVSYLKRDEFMHHEEFLAFIPITKDAPVLEILTEKKKIHLYLNDLCIEKGRKYDVLEFYLKEKGMDEFMDFMVLQAYTGTIDSMDVFENYLSLYFDMMEKSPSCDSDEKRKILKAYVYNLYAGKNLYSSPIIKKIGLEKAKELYGKYLYFSIDTSIVNHSEDMKIRRLYEIIKKNPEAGYTLVFKGRSLPATFAEAYTNKEKDGSEYLSIAFWDGDSGNLFDIRYTLVPEKVFIDGQPVEF